MGQPLRTTDTADYLHPLTHHGDPLPEITITTPRSTRTFASSALIETHLDDLHRGAEPVLVTLRCHRTALTIGLGHPSLSVALYLDSNDRPWHATGDESATNSAEHAEIEWQGAEGSHTFDKRAYVAIHRARSIATAFVADPATKQRRTTWGVEGPA